MTTFLYIFMIIIAIPMIALGKKFAPRIIDCLRDMELGQEIKNQAQIGEICNEN